MYSGASFHDDRFHLAFGFFSGVVLVDLPAGMPGYALLAWAALLDALGAEAFGL
jgi:hypothetical protein